MKYKLTTSLGGILLSFASIAPVQGIMTFWQVEGTFSAATTDSLGIDGQSFSYTLTIDHDGAVWEDVGGELYYPTAASSVSITGPHSIALKSDTPAIRIRSANDAVVPVEAVGTASFMDFIIDGTTFTNAANTAVLAPPVVPTAGDSFIPDHLTTVYGVPTIINGPDGENYNVIDGTVSITTIPEPTSTALAFLGLGGLMGRRRRAA